jgi:hypothetical protein
MKRIYTTLLILITSVCYGQAMFLSINIYGQDTCNDVPQNCDSLFATFASKKGGIITKKELSLGKGLAIKSSGATCKARVLSYNISLNGNEVINYGPYLTESAKKLLSYARPGDDLSFEFIKVKEPYGYVRNLGAISFTVK